MVKNIFKSISRPSANNCKKPHQKISILRKVMLVFITRPFKRPRGGYGLKTRFEKNSRYRSRTSQIYGYQTRSGTGTNSTATGTGPEPET